MRRLLALPLVAVVVLLAAGVSNAGREQMTLTCTGFGQLTVTVTTTKSDHSVAWGTGKVSSSMHGIPVSFSGTFINLNTGIPAFSFLQQKGNGHGLHNQSTVMCTAPPVTGTAADFGITGLSPTTPVEFEFSAQVVIKQQKH
jgi:YD repeat-containing protein